MNYLLFFLFIGMAASCGNEKVDDLQAGHEDDIREDSNADYYFSKSDGLNDSSIYMLGKMTGGKAFFVTDYKIGFLENFEPKEVSFIDLPTSTLGITSAEEMAGLIYLVVPLGVIQVDYDGKTAELIISAEDTLKEVPGIADQSKYGMTWNDFIPQADGIALLTTSGFFSGLDPLDLSRQYGGILGFSRSLSDPVFLDNGTTVMCDTLTYDLTEEPKDESTPEPNNDERGFSTLAQGFFSYLKSGFAEIKPSNPCLLQQYDESTFFYPSDNGLAIYNNGEVSELSFPHGKVVRFSSNKETVLTLEDHENELYHSAYRYDGTTYEKINLSGTLLQAAPTDILQVGNIDYIGTNQGIFVFVR